MSIESVMPSNHVILCCSLLLLPSVFPSIRVFSSELAFHARQWWQTTERVFFFLKIWGEGMAEKDKVPFTNEIIAWRIQGLASDAVQFSCSVVSDSSWLLWTAARQASLSFTNSRSLPKLMSIKSVMPSDHLILCCPLLLLPSSFPSLRVFFPVSQLFTSGWPIALELQCQHQSFQWIFRVGFL